MSHGGGGCNLHFCRYESGELRKEEEEDEEAAADRDWKKQRHTVRWRALVEGGRSLQSPALPLPSEKSCLEGGGGPTPTCTPSKAPSYPWPQYEAERGPPLVLI